MSTDLRGYVAIVTGAASGLGYASAKALAVAGARVVLNDVDKAAVERAVERLGADGDILAHVADVSELHEVEGLFRRAKDAWGGIDIVFANAGVEQYESLETMSEDNLERLLNVNLKGTLLCMREAIPYMRARNGGSIIATSSVQASHSLPGCVVYAAAKAGIISAVRTLALEVGTENIRVNAISPGTIDTPMLQRDLADMDQEGHADFVDRVRGANALQRIGTPEEVADAVLWLASAASSYVTAANIVVDGGFTAVKSF